MSGPQEIASKLISFPTVSPKGDELQCARYIFDFLKDLNVRDSDIRLDEFDGTRANVVATFGREKDPGLLISGHMDVVPVGDPKSWRSDPFVAKIEDGKMYGRGASDMKGGLASIMKAVGQAVKNENLKRRLVLVATAGEETGFVGLTRLIQNSILDSKSATCVVIGEPTDLRPARAHRGIYRIKVEFIGKSSHASKPELGVNAIEYACKFVAKLDDIREEFSKTADKLLSTTTLTPTLMSGGIGENVIPPNAEVVLDSRRLPSHSEKYILSKIEQELRNLDAQYKVSEIVNHPPLYTAENNFLVKLAERITGTESVACAFGTEGALYSGKLGIPTVAIGPGSVERIHVVNESVELAQLEKAASIYSALIKEVCL